MEKTENMSGVRQKLPQVTEGLISVQNAIASLDDSIYQLAERLSGVLVPDSPVPTGTLNDKTEQAKAPIAAELTSIAEKIRSSNSRVENLLTRLEV